jgi:hypothetical protein
MMPRDKLMFGLQGIIVVYVLYQVTSSVYNHLKAKDRLKRKFIDDSLHRIVSLLPLVVKLLYKDNVD